MRAGQTSKTTVLVATLLSGALSVCSTFAEQSPDGITIALIDKPWAMSLNLTGYRIHVRIDVVLEEQDHTTIEAAQELLAEARAMLRPSEEGDGFGRSYYEALQRTPDVVLAHATVKKLLSTARTTAVA